MIVKFFILLTLTTSQAFAWEVLSKKGEFYLRDGKDIFSITSEGGTPKFLQVESWEKDYKKVTYFAGAAGTSQICEITRALLINRENKVLGDLPISYKCQNEKGQSLDKATWVRKNDVLEVSDPQTDEVIKIILNKK